MTVIAGSFQHPDFALGGWILGIGTILTLLVIGMQKRG